MHIRKTYDVSFKWYKPFCNKIMYTRVAFLLYARSARIQGLVEAPRMAGVSYNWKKYS
jgi:hypothetical protein